ncbi:GPR1/FUN34/YaaH family transporter [Streptomyces sp. NPDC058417]|uniref:GPR1/FUN34/YaaH family transporter n=1 Tax=unclassified Streptomyces TaxID=2593676 RepID=UPI0036495187
MDSDVSAGRTTTSSVVGRLALGITLLAFGLGHTAVIDGVTAADAVSLARYVGGVALFLAGLLALRDGDTVTGTAFSVVGALWFTWAVSAGAQVSENAAATFLLLFALVALTLALAVREQLDQGTYGLFAIALVLLAVGVLADSGGLAKVGGWVAVAAGAVAWYAGAAALAQWPTAFARGSGRAGRSGVTATG